YFFFQEEDGIRAFHVTGVQTCALPILPPVAPVRDQAADGEHTPHNEPGTQSNHDDAAQEPHELRAGREDGARVDRPILLSQVLLVARAETLHRLRVPGKRLDDELPGQIRLQPRGYVA